MFPSATSGYSHSMAGVTHFGGSLKCPKFEEKRMFNHAKAPSHPHQNPPLYPPKNGGSPKQRCPKKLVVPKKTTPKWKFHVVPQFHQGTKASSKIYSLGWCQFRCRALGFFPRQRFDSTKKLVRLPTKHRDHRDFMRLPNGFQLIWSGWRWRCRSGDPILGNLTWTHTHWHLRNLVWGSCIWVISNKDEQLLFGGRCINQWQHYSCHLEFSS